MAQVTMGTSFKAMLSRLSPERQARIKAGADRLEAEIAKYPVAPRLSPSGTYYICQEKIKTAIAQELFKQGYIEDWGITRPVVTSAEYEQHRIVALVGSMVDRLQSLVAGVEFDIDTPLSPDDE